MCGIAGVVGKKDLVSAKNEVGLMQKALQHRGPNDAGIEAWDLAVLGHRRLSILDLSLAGHQPMLSPDGELGIVFNGAIYNFLNLRDELQSNGYNFKSQTDTEVLLHGFREWGIDKLVEKIEGMFAFALWDNRHETLYLVRDRLGVKPLVYSTRNGELAFASTIRALKCAGYGGELDKRAMTEYLEFGFVTDDLSIYEGIEKLPAATILKWHRGEIRTKKYWDLSESKDDKISFEDAVEETERLFLEAVEKRLQADVPIGALLSGGIDSSLICWALAKLGSDVTAFTVSIPNDEWDESGAAIQTAKKLGIKHRVLEMSGGDSFDANELSRAYAEPFACASALGLLSVSREIASSATVLLTGDGGDDVFLGYPEHRHFRLAEKVAQNTPREIEAVLQKAVSIFPKKGALKRAGSFLSYSFGGLGAVTQARDGLPVYEKNDLLGERLTGFEFPHREIPLTSGKNLLSDFLAYDRKTRFTGEYLPKVDGGTMFYALEARSPFLDIKLWEFASTLPYSLRLRKNTLKAVLREIVSRRIDPELARAKKQGFGVPVQRWLVKKWRPLVEEMMSDSLLEKDGWIKTRNALRMIDNAANGNWAPRQIWFIFVLEAWLRFEKELYD
jgi:asparagine synthase (glutamine-hydrolysing)